MEWKMERVTIKTLRKTVDNLNLSQGLPVKVWTRQGSDNVAHVGCYVLDCAYGGYQLAQIVTPGGGERDITPRTGARQCADLIRVYQAGLDMDRGDRA
jgi:hypothetical protein